MSLPRQILSLLIIAAILYGGYMAYLSGAFSQLGFAPPVTVTERPAGKAAPKSVITALVKKEMLEIRVEAVGTTLAAQSVDIPAGAEGTVEEILFAAGERVRRGDPLVRLGAKIAQADLAEARASLGEVRSRLARAQALRRNNTVSEAAVEQILSEEAAAIAAFNRAEKRLADRVVRAPFGGILGFPRIETGARVNEDTLIAGLDDLSSVRLRFNLSETRFGQVTPGQTVLADAAAFPGQIFEGTINSIDNRIDVVSRAFEVRAVFPNPEGLLPSGMFMHVTLVLDEIEALVVPEEALVPSGGDIYVFVVADGVAERRKVQTGQRTLGRVAITEGAIAGERVVIEGQARLRDGAAVIDKGSDQGAGEETVVPDA